jgi:hypothetical protein
MQHAASLPHQQSTSNRCTDTQPAQPTQPTAGVAGAVILPVTGLSVGVVQVCRGIINQPEALVASHQGKAWDPVRRRRLGDGAARERGCVCVAAGVNTRTHIPPHTHTLSYTRTHTNAPPRRRAAGSRPPPPTSRCTTPSRRGAAASSWGRRRRPTTTRCCRWGVGWWGGRVACVLV